MRKMLLLELVAAGLLAMGLISIFNIGIVSAVTQWTGLDGPNDVAIGDYNNDGLNDIAFSESWGGRVTVYKSDGVTIIKQWAGLGRPSGVAIGDYDNDGLNDIAISDYDDGTVKVYKSDGVTIIKQWVGLNIPTDVFIGDYNNDGLNDIAIMEGDVGPLTVYYQTGPPVGGILIPIDKLGLLAPYIGLASTIVVATAATAIYVKRVKRRKEKQ